MTAPPRLLDVLRSLGDARFWEVADAVGARPYLSPGAAPVTRALELDAWSRETPEQDAALRRALARELHDWPDDVLARYRAFATTRLGELPLLGFQGTVRAPIDLHNAFVPLSLDARATPGELHRADTTDGWALADVLRDAESAAPTCRGVALIGLPGSGKTTLLKHAWGVVADRGAADLGLALPTLQPVFVRLGAAHPDHPAHDLLPEALRATLAQQGFAAAADLLLARPLVWMLDGLDEAGSPARRRQLAERLADAFDRRPDDRYLLTSRTAGWRDVEGLFTGRLRAWNVAPLRYEDLGPFIERWHRAAEQVLAGPGSDRARIDEVARAAAAELTPRLLGSAWMADSRRERMARNPLMLSVLCLVHRQRGQLPEKRHLLYDAALDVMFEQLPRLDPFGGAAPVRRHQGLPKEEGLRLLAALAWGAHHAATTDTDVAVFSTAEAAAWMKPVLDRFPWPEHPDPGPAELLRRAEEDCGLLTSPAADQWQFAHLTFQEYLAARHADAEGLGAELAALAHLDRWEEPVRLAMRFPRLSVDLLHALLARPDLPWDRPRFDALLRDLAREADPTPFADALTRAHAALAGHRCALLPDAVWSALTGRMPPADAERLADHLLRLFTGRAPPGMIEQAARQLADLRDAPAARSAARALLGAPEDAPVTADGITLRTLDLPGGIRLSLAAIPAGEFWMGATTEPGARNHDPEAYGDEAPVRRVRLTADYWLGVHPVTNAQYRAFTTATGHRASPSWSREGFDADDQPVTGVAWHDAAAFCAWLSGVTGEPFALPTEAQWERAARGDDARRYPWGDEPPTPERAAFEGAGPAPVGSHPAGVGPYGTHDQAGNVWEWCRDRHADYPTVSTVDIDPCQEPPGASSRVVRGGSWGHLPRYLRAAYRLRLDPGRRNGHLGFRVCAVREPGR